MCLHWKRGERFKMFVRTGREKLPKFCFWYKSPEKKSCSVVLNEREISVVSHLLASFLVAIELKVFQAIMLFFLCFHLGDRLMPAICLWQIIAVRRHVVSFVQIRGSIPVYWSQTSAKYRPPPKVERSETSRLKNNDVYACGTERRWQQSVSLSISVRMLPLFVCLFACFSTSAHACVCSCLCILGALSIATGYEAVCKHCMPLFYAVCCPEKHVDRQHLFFFFVCVQLRRKLRRRSRSTLTRCWKNIPTLWVFLFRLQNLNFFDSSFTHVLHLFFLFFWNQTLL